MVEYAPLEELLLFLADSLLLLLQGAHIPPTAQSERGYPL